MLNKTMNYGHRVELAYDVKSEANDFNKTVSNMVFSPMHISNAEDS